MKFRKKPVVIDAFRYGMEDAPEWFREAKRNRLVSTFSQYGGETRWCEIETLEGTMRGEVGDWIILGIQGEIYPCKSDIFYATYEAVEKEGDEK